MTGTAAAGSQMEQVEIGLRNLGQAWDQFAAGVKDPQEKALVERLTNDQKEFVKNGLLAAVAAIRAGDMKLATEITQGPMTLLFLPVKDGIDELVKLQVDSAHQAEEWTKAIEDSAKSYSCIPSSKRPDVLGALKFTDEDVDTQIRGAVLLLAICAFGDSVIGPPLRNMLDQPDGAMRELAAKLLPAFFTPGT